MAFSPLNTLGYSLCSSLPSPPPASARSSSFFSNLCSTSPQGSYSKEAAAPKPPKTFCIFTSTPSFFSQICPETDSSTYSSTYSTPSSYSDHVFYSSRYRLITEFLAANADYFASRRGAGCCSTFTAGLVPSSAGTVYPPWDLASRPRVAGTPC